MNIAFESSTDIDHSILVMEKSFLGDSVFHTLSAANTFDGVSLLRVGKPKK